MAGNAYKQTIAVKDGIVYARLSGEFPARKLEAEGNVFQPLVDACGESEKKRILIDSRDLEVKLGVVGLLKAGTDIASLAFKGVRLACLTRKVNIDPFFENVAVNRGGLVRVFTKASEAERWLADE